MHRLEVSHRRQRVFDGRVAANARTEDDRRSILQAVRSSCSAIGPTKQSPILLAVERAVELAAQDRVGHEVEIHVVTDLAETVDGSLTRDLRAKRFSGKPGAIDNRQIAVSFCGTAAARDPDAPHNVGDASQRYDVWRARFKEPTTVTFQPFCALGDSANLNSKDGIVRP